MRQGVPLTSYFLALFSLLVPIIFGTFNYRKLTLPLIYILIFLIFGLIYSITQVYLKNPLSYNIQFYIFHLLFNLFYSLVFFHWAEIRKVNIYVILQLFIYFSSVIIEVYIIGLSSFRISIAVVINQIFYCLFAVYLINKILSNEDSKVERRVKLLVLIPFFVFYTYMNIIDIFMFFLFTPDTQKLFSNLYWVIRILNPINYLCVSLAFYLAPKKVAYLE